MIDINKLIMEAMKAHKDPVIVESYRSIKAKILEFKTQKNAPEYNDAAEIKLLQKMVKERMESYEIYNQNNRNDLAEHELNQANVIKALIPDLPSESDIESFVNDHYPDGLEQKQLGSVIKELKSVYPTADGSMVAKIVKSKIK